MTCGELRQDYAVYALGILEDPERAEITEHLLRKCENCVPGVASALATVSAMSGAVKIAEPPPGLRRRVVAMVNPADNIAESKRGWSFFLPWGLATALAAALVVTIVSGTSVSDRRASADMAKLGQALSILNDPATKDVSFGETRQPAKGRVFVHAARGVVFMAAHLPRIDAGKTFELWVITATGNPIPAGTFSSDADNTAMYVRPGPVEANASAFAVTVEPAGGSALPTTKPFIVAGLS
jgi:anti-sigma-K factor RskA